MAEIPLDEEDFDSAAMAAAMGFSSFGGPASKKRKFNPHADAAVVAFSSSGGPAPAPSGANTTALGERQPRGPAPSSSDLPLHLPVGLPARPSRPGSGRGQNSDEIDLDGDGDEDADPEPQYLDTSRPARRLSSAEREARETQERIDAIVTAKVDETMAHAQIQGGAAASVPGSVHGGRGGGHGPRHHHGGGQHPGRGEPGHIWWEGYHDPSFNENPWERLEKARGLEPRGTWVPRVARSG